MYIFYETFCKKKMVNECWLLYMLLSSTNLTDILQVIRDNGKPVDPPRSSLGLLPGHSTALSR